MLLDYDPDFICMQEFDPLYRTPSDGSDGLITLISEQYTEVSIDGVEKNRVYNPIFFNHTDYSLVTSGYVEKYTVNSEEFKYPGYHDDRIGEGTTYGRSLVWAVLEDAVGDRFLVANVHFTPPAKPDRSDIGEIQKAEAEFVAKELKDIAADYKGIITLVAGDMNSATVTAPETDTNRLWENFGVDTMLKNGFTHTYNLASAKNNLESYHDGKAPSTGYLEWAIDHILTLNADLNVRSFYVLNDAALYSVSDHLPVKMSFYK